MATFRMSFAAKLIAGLILGVAIGLLLPSLGAGLRPVGSLFGEALKIPVVPVVFLAGALGLLRAVAAMRGAGRIGVVSAAAFVLFSIIAVAIGVGLAVAFLPHPTETAGDAAVAAVDWIAFLTKAIPSNLVASMAAQDMLAILVAGLLFGAALATMGRAAAPVVAGLDTCMAALMRITHWIVAMAPVAVVAAIAALTAAQNWDALLGLARLVGLAYAGLAILTALFCCVLLAIGERPLAVIRSVSTPLILGFATRASMSVMPVHMESLVRAGVPDHVVRTCLPLGHVFLRAGSVLYIVLAVVFLAETHADVMSAPTLLTIALTVLLLNLGAATLPSGGLLIVAAALTAIGLPAGDVAIIAAIDALPDAGRTVVNIFANTVATKVVQYFAGGSGPQSDETVRSDGSDTCLQGSTASCAPRGAG